ncbi:hypothetical protein [Methanolobus profundi]|uniref:DUF4352 domain-containing protein n=1 Tax=Methanolobus profundi TaxID=487685 RepID=A0A1I4PBL6_9EURY|nr:hypothetical protein [Methanolobus profundi]SFM25099.1 hypothetical protein SAMN04488696_0556 [Methanolobus profundi]
MEKNLSYALLIITVGILIGFSGNIWSCGPVQVEGLLVVEGVSSMGLAENNSSVTIYTYEFTLYNSGQEDVYVTSVEPILADSPYILTSQDSVLQDINGYVEAGSSMNVGGTVELFTEGMSKEEIMDLEPIVNVRVSSTETMPI